MRQPKLVSRWWVVTTSRIIGLKKVEAQYDIEGDARGYAAFLLKLRPSKYRDVEVIDQLAAPEGEATE